MVIAQREIWWADLGDPIGSAPGYIRPILVIQGDRINATALGTVLCIPLTANLRWAKAVGNVLLPARETGLDRDSVANVSQITAVDRRELRDRTGQIGAALLHKVFLGIDTVLGR